jgi:cysteine synthase
MDRRVDSLGLATDVVDRAALDRTVERFAGAGLRLPTFAELAAPATLPAALRAALAAVDSDAAAALNLFRVHWYNDGAGGLLEVPEHLVLPPSFTGVAAPIVVALADRFPMIHAHKVLAAYACLAPRLVTGQFDPGAHRAVWPSTGNYCRGGVAISRIMGCRGVAVLPEGMSRERFRWLEQWVAEPADVIRTPGVESNVKEIYDRCALLARDPANVILNQFSEFGNHLAHFACTGEAFARVFEAVRAARPELNLAAYVSATGSAGTLGAGDLLKERYGCRIVAAEALECPTMLENGYGEHNIQGIGDKHIPLIHNVMNTDVVVAISDRATDALGVVFDAPQGRAWLAAERDVPAGVIERLGDLGLSSICNVLAAIKAAKALGLGAHDAIVTVATDGAEMYGSERDKARARFFAGGVNTIAAAETFERHVLAADIEHVLVAGDADRRRIFNLGYFTWVEQQGVAIADFDARRGQAFWRSLRELLPAWDDMIREFNGRTGVRPA